MAVDLRVLNCVIDNNFELGRERASLQVGNLAFAFIASCDRHHDAPQASFSQARETQMLVLCKFQKSLSHIASVKFCLRY